MSGKIKISRGNLEPGVGSGRRTSNPGPGSNFYLGIATYLFLLKKRKILMLVSKETENFTLRK